MPGKKIGWGMPSPQGWRAMFVYRGDDGKVVLRTSPLKFWNLVEASWGRLQTSGVTEDAEQRRVVPGAVDAERLALLCCA